MTIVIIQRKKLLNLSFLKNTLTKPLYHFQALAEHRQCIHQGTHYRHRDSNPRESPRSHVPSGSRHQLQ